MRQVEELGTRLAYSAYQQMLAQADTMIAYSPDDPTCYLGMQS